MALRSGISLDDFYRMTPWETYMVIDARNWCDQQQNKQLATIAWLNAVLARQKRITPLKSILAALKQPVRLTGAELAARRQEFQELATPEIVRQINASVREKS